MWQKVLDSVTNKFHIVMGSAAQGALIIYHIKTGKDIGPGIQNSLYAYYAFLLGHAGVYQKWPDSDGSR